MKTDLTLTERAIGHLHRDIMSGCLAPGAKLTVAYLATAYGIGMTPIREALARLVSKNLVIATGRRGFRVCEMNREDLADITSTRYLIEMEAIRLSMLRGDDVWEAEIIAKLHRLRLHVERCGTQFGAGGEEFDSLHHQFHASLLAASNSARLNDMAANLYDQACRYRQSMMRRLVDTEQFIQIHVDLVESVVARNPDAVAPLLKQHLYSTLRSVYPEPSHEVATRAAGASEGRNHEARQ